MKEVIVHVDIKDIAVLQEIREFISYYLYSRSFNTDPHEWGRLEIGNVRLTFLADVETETKQTYKIRQR